MFEKECVIDVYLPQNSKINSDVLYKMIKSNLDGDKWQEIINTRTECIEMSSISDVREQTTIKMMTINPMNTCGYIKSIEFNDDKKSIKCHCVFSRDISVKSLYPIIMASSDDLRLFKFIPYNHI